MTSADLVLHPAANDNRGIILGVYDRLMAAKSLCGWLESSGNQVTNVYGTEEAKSLISFLQFFQAVAFAVPDYRVHIDGIAGKGELVMVRYTVSGTQTGTLMGTAPSNARVTINGIDVFRLIQGKIIEYWDTARQINSLAIMQN